MNSAEVPQAEHFRVMLDPDAVLPAYARHRRRFAAAVASLDESALATPSRCAEWTVADVLRHGCDVDGWMQAFWTGDAPPFTRFDPKETPKEWVIAGRAVPDLEVRDRYVASAETMAADVSGSTPERWGLPSISPFGFVPWWLSALHVLFDSTVHERDVLLPLGVDVAVVADEDAAVLTYVLAATGTLIREPTDAVIAGVRLTVDGGVSAATPDDVESGAVGIIDALSGRGDVEAALSGVDPEVVQRLGVLGNLLSE